MDSDKLNEAMIGFVKLQKDLKLNDTEKYALNASSVAILIQSWNDAGYGSIENLIFTFVEKVNEIIEFTNQPEQKAKLNAIIKAN